MNDNHPSNSDINKFTEVIENMKNHKDRKDLQEYVAKYVLPKLLADGSPTPSVGQIIDIFPGRQPRLKITIPSSQCSQSVRFLNPVVNVIKRGKKNVEKKSPDPKSAYNIP